MPIAVGCMAGGSVTALMRPWQLGRCYRALGGDPRNPKSIYLEVEDEVLVSGIEGKSEGRFMRGGIPSFSEDDEFLLLFVSPKRFLYIPKGRLPAEAIDELHVWLRLPVGAK
jgi:hypothetical protein